MVVLTNFPPPAEGIRCEQANTEVHVKGMKNPNSRTLGRGTLYIAESRLSWVGDDEKGFSLEYPAISLHAVSRDLSSFSQECLYLMVEGDCEEPVGQNGHSGADEEDDEEDDSQPVTEFRFVPQDKGQLNAMFEALSDCQILHPDQADSDSGDDDFYGEEEEEGNSATLQHLESIFSVGNIQPNGHTGEETMQAEVEEEDMETGQFEDADVDK